MPLYTKVSMVPDAYRAGGVVIEMMDRKVTASKEECMEMMKALGEAINGGVPAPLMLEAVPAKRMKAVTVSADQARNVWESYKSAMSSERKAGAMSRVSAVSNVPYNVVREIIAAFRAEQDKLFKQGRVSEAAEERGYVLKPPKYYGEAAR